jgi:hypothetical protein
MKARDTDFPTFCIQGAFMFSIDRSRWSFAPAGATLWLATPGEALLAACGVDEIDAALLAAVASPCAKRRHGLALVRRSPGVEALFAIAFDRPERAETALRALGAWADRLVAEAALCRKAKASAAQSLMECLDPAGAAKEPRLAAVAPAAPSASRAAPRAAL